MKLRHIFLLSIVTILLTACNQTLAADVTPPPNYVPPTPAPTLGPLFPEQAPNVENGKAIYAEKCAACHGDTGLGNGPQSADLPVSVIPIGLPEFANDATPSNWYGVVSQGRIERFMPPFNSLSDQERWDVVYYALMLQTTQEQVELGKTLFEENCGDCTEAFTNLQMMSALSKADIVKLIREGSGDFPAFGSAFSDEDAFAVAAYIRTLTFAAPSELVADTATETPDNAAVVTSSAEETPADGTPQAEVTEEPVSASMVKGQIDNRTGEDLPSDLVITLRGFDHGSNPNAGPTEILAEPVTINPDGSFTFEVELIENQIYLAEAEIDGMLYQSEFAVVAPGVSELVLEPIVIYATTEDLSILTVESVEYYFDLASEEANYIFTVYTINNASDQTLLFNVSENANIPFIAFPEGATGIGFETTETSAPFKPTSNENVVAMPPSELPYGLIAFSSLPKSEEINISQPAVLDLNAITILLPEGMEAEGTTLSSQGIQNIQGTNYQVYSAAPVAGGTSFDFNLTGRPVTVSESPDITQNQYVLIGVGALGITLILAGVFMYMRDKNKEEDGDEEESEEDDDDQFEDTESVMDAIIALDDLHRAGKISDEAYKKRRAELANALKKGQ